MYFSHHHHHLMYKIQNEQETMPTWVPETWIVPKKWIDTITFHLSAVWIKNSIATITSRRQRLERCACVRLMMILATACTWKLDYVASLIFSAQSKVGQVLYSWLMWERVANLKHDFGQAAKTNHNFLNLLTLSNFDEKSGLHCNISGLSLMRFIVFVFVRRPMMIMRGFRTSSWD